VARLNRLGRPPSDALGARVAALLRIWGPDRERLYGGLFVPADDSQPFATLERALRLTAETAPAEEAVRSAVRAGRLADERDIGAAVEAGVLTREAARHLTEARALRHATIEVDAFPAPARPGVAAQPPLAPAAHNA
jgi:acyl-CoA dehydrogenase